jgi:hypothetical protein
MDYQTARRQITEILAQLEIDQNARVESIDVRSFDATTLKDERRQIRRSVEITLSPMPGAHWVV